MTQVFAATLSYLAHNSAHTKHHPKQIGKALVKQMKFAHTIIPIHSVLHQIQTSHPEFFYILIFLMALAPIILQAAVIWWGYLCQGQINIVHTPAE